MEKVKHLRFVFMGSPAMSAEFLDYLITEQFNVVAVVTNPAKKVGRKQIIMNTPVYDLAVKHNIKTFTPHNIKEDYSFMNKLNADVILTFAYGQIVPKAVLESAKLGAYNYHGSILPKYRGASPMQAALINGDKLTGVSLMKMVEKMDAGEVYGIKMFPLFPEDNIETVTNKTIHAAKCVTREHLSNVLLGTNKGTPQDETKVSFTKLLKREDLYITKTMPLVNFLGTIRAFSPEPGAILSSRYGELKIYEAKLYSNQIVIEPGELFVIHKRGLFYQHTDGVLELITVQKPGKNIVSGLNFANGEQSITRLSLGIFDD